jgi:hypothetical protein
MSDIVVEIKPHIGLQRTKIGVLKVDMRQSIVFANGIQVGFIGNRSTSGIKLIHMTLPLSAKEEIKRQVDALLGRVTPPIVNAAVILEEDDTQEDDD